MSTSGGYHEYVHRGDIMSTSGGVQYIGGGGWRGGTTEQLTHQNILKMHELETACE